MIGFKVLSVMFWTLNIYVSFLLQVRLMSHDLFMVMSPRGLMDCAIRPETVHVTSISLD